MSQVKAQCLICVIRHFICVHHVRSLHYHIQICAIISVSRLVEYSVSRAMTFWNRDIGLSCKVLNSVRLGNFEDVNEVSAEVRCQEEVLRGVDNGLVDVRVHRLTCLGVGHVRLELEELFLDNVRGGRMLDIEYTDTRAAAIKAVLVLLLYKFERTEKARA